MSANLSSIVAEGRIFDDVKVSSLPNGGPAQVKEFKNCVDKSSRKLKLLVIDQAEDLLLRFVESDSAPASAHHQRTTSNSNSHHNNHNHNTSVSSNNSGALNQTSGDSSLTSNSTNTHAPSTNGHHANKSIVVNERCDLELNLHRESDSFVFGDSKYLIHVDSKQALLMLEFRDKKDQNRFARIVEEFKQHQQQSTFNQRTDAASASQYFQFYGYLSQQQNMMQDYVRTSTYQRAILSNSVDFKNKVVLDVGAGSGILSFFALQAGARVVYAVEASSMAKHAQLLAQSNQCGNKIKVLAGKLEEIEIPEPVDVIISEPMGYMLFNERMLETYLHSKKWFRSPEQGKMFPARGDLHVAPFTDAQLYLEQTNKANFWFSNDFHGVDLRALHSAATNEYFKQPIVDTFDMRICMAKTVRHIIDFQKAHETDLHCISIPLEFIANQTGHIHGLAFWFDVAFIGSEHTIWLSTSPSQPLTHWYQVRCLLNSPLFVNKGQFIYGSCVLRSNKRQSYDVDIELFIKELGTRSSNTLDLKNPYFRYTGQPVQAPPGVNEISPSEQLWSTLTYDQYSQPNQLLAGVPGLVNQIGAANPTAMIAAAVDPSGFPALPAINAQAALAHSAQLVMANEKHQQHYNHHQQQHHQNHLQLQQQQHQQHPQQQQATNVHNVRIV